jgi:hypothetical protein
MIVALAGRRIDAPDSETKRFPLENVELVRRRIKALFQKNDVKLLVSSAACGADLLALEAGGQMGIERHIILPFERARFRETSVTDRPGDWGKLFDEICGEVEKEGKLTVLEGFENEDKAYSAATIEILNKAESLHSSGEDQKLGVIIWEGNAKSEKDETAAFAAKARELNFVVKEILTK